MSALLHTAHEHLQPLEKTEVAEVVLSFLNSHSSGLVNEMVKLY